MTFRINKDGYYEGKRRRGITGLLHRIVMEEHIGRKLLTCEVVHHKDGNKLNNDLSNLEIMSNRDHSMHHNSHLIKTTKTCNECKRDLARCLFKEKNKGKGKSKGIASVCKECESMWSKSRDIRTLSALSRVIMSISFGEF